MGGNYSEASFLVFVVRMPSDLFRCAGRKLTDGTRRIVYLDVVGPSLHGVDAPVLPGIPQPMGRRRFGVRDDDLLVRDSITAWIFCPPR